MIYLSKKEFDDAMEKVMGKFKELEDKINLIKSNQELQIKESGKSLYHTHSNNKIIKKVK